MGASFCCACDAPSRECDHDAPRYLAPIAYERIEDPDSGQLRWRVPDSERARCDHPSSTWARADQRGAGASPDGNPFDCAGCGAPLPRWARMRGFTHCSRECREGRRSNAA